VVEAYILMMWHRGWLVGVVHH